MADYETEPGERDSKATLFLGEDPVRQSPGMICCPLGMWIVSPRPIEPDTLISATLQGRDNTGATSTVSCRGVVAECREEGGHSRFRICVIFTDLDPQKRRVLHSLSLCHHTLCSYCANF